jgi:hypothetical protein
MVVSKNVMPLETHFQAQSKHASTGGTGSRGPSWKHSGAGFVKCLTHRGGIAVL